MRFNDRYMGNNEELVQRSDGHASDTKDFPATVASPCPIVMLWEGGVDEVSLRNKATESNETRTHKRQETVKKVAQGMLVLQMGRRLVPRLSKWSR
jgi:hypothetical protein